MRRPRTPSRRDPQAPMQAAAEPAGLRAAGNEPLPVHPSATGPAAGAGWSAHLAADGPSPSIPLGPGSQERLHRPARLIGPPRSGERVHAGLHRGA